jgi:plastocyanin
MLDPEPGITGNMRILTKLTIALAVVLGLAFTAVSVNSHAPAGAQAGGKTITIKDFKNDPAKLAVKVGEAVTVKNDDVTPHTVTAKDGSFNADVQPGSTATLTVSKPGSHPYDCTYHPGQHQPPNASIDAS